jgi:hypothetical protein
MTVSFSFFGPGQRPHVWPTPAPAQSPVAGAGRRERASTRAVTSDPRFNAFPGVVGPGFQSGLLVQPAVIESAQLGSLILWLSTPGSLPRRSLPRS